ncbi:unnamed protein product, partial [Discosporangium mesarthrocarpum]
PAELDLGSGQGWRRGRGRGSEEGREGEWQEEEEEEEEGLFSLPAPVPDSVLDLEAALEFIDQVGHTSAFQTLRTEEQLGYIVATQLGRGPSTVPGMGPLGWSVLVQGAGRAPGELEERVDAWVAQFRGELGAMSQKEFDATVGALLSGVLRRER